MSNIAIIEIAVIISLGSFVYYIFYKKKIKHQLNYISNYKFPTKISIELKNRYPYLTDLDIEKVLLGLKDYFYISRLSKSDEIVGMPSKIVDEAWHEFILFTQLYEKFCKKAFGKFHHHIPAEAMKNPDDGQYSIRIAWYYACQKDYIYMPDPKKLPLIFAIDKMLKIENGFYYTLDCIQNPNEFCVKNIRGTGKSGSGCGGASCGGGCGG